tara:strand:- start:133 stop:1872 length:1740 start_codon:yes stop_codon:yes gene_type:complete
MNKTLLLIICDFLLLNLIHFTAWDKLKEEPPKEKAPASGGPAQAGLGMGDPSRDLEFVTLKYKNTRADLENEQINTAALQAEMKASEKQSAGNLAAAVKNAHAWKNVFDQSTETNKILAAATNELSRAQVIALAERDKERTLKETITKERTQLQASNRDLTNQVNNLTQATNRLTASIGDLKNSIGDLKLDLRKAGGDAKEAQRRAEEAQKRAEQAAAREKAALISKTKAEGERNQARQAANSALDMAADAKRQATNQIKTVREFATRQLNAANNRVRKAEDDRIASQNEAKSAVAKVAEKEKELDVSKAKTMELAKNVVREEKEKIVAQKNHAEALRQLGNKPLVPNAMAQKYFKNKVDLQFKEPGRFFGGTTTTSSTVLVEVMEKGTPHVYAITHLKETPYMKVGRMREIKGVSGALKPRNGVGEAFDNLLFLKADPRVTIISVGLAGSAKVKALGVNPYKLATDPFKFPTAFIMSKNGEKFGTTDFYTDPNHKGYVKVDRIAPLLNFGGKFTPTRGDLVFSRTGDLLGLMANNKYCLVIQNATTNGGLQLGKGDLKLGQTLVILEKLINAKPRALR